MNVLFSSKEYDFHTLIKVGVTKAPSCPGHAESLVIPKFRITRLIPNKIRIPKPSRESLQRKDFCIKTSG